MLLGTPPQRSLGPTGLLRGHTRLGHSSCSLNVVVGGGLGIRGLKVGKPL